ncbi:ABC transporter ATP-binding protein [Longimicrobium terrae]|uniref:ABC transporter ATP-binding protein n=1 Tax=Longimicrobium terrae TaxID=1639882 RepID=UPI0014749A13|nr:ABC transporter ATP-binding protein [Longimicrobium terrae]MBB4639350.1 oligopeptide/dipeptide ABC transporter ATP-binding protein [Longimicrobium terrae]NNC29413.1 ABC transporter ATP-binding protein [Longimicrobium terrae]
MGVDLTQSDIHVVPAAGSGPILQVENLRTWFSTDNGVARAVDGVSFHVNPGETLGIVGESGSGKSVTSLSVMRLIPQPPGKIQDGSKILFRGSNGEMEDLARASEQRMRQIRGNDIAMIFQEPMTSLNPVFTVGEQIMESLRLHQGLSKKAARTRAIEMLQLVGIPIPDQRVDEYPHQLSGGMRQRVMIAMALACDPKLLIADEPTTALDVTIQAQILELLNKLQQELGMSIILITHDLGVVAETCDRVIVMYAGQVFEEGPVDDVFHNPQNPYTEGLLRSMPKLGQDVGRLAVIPGVVPSPLNWPQGCRFQDRCPYSWEKPEKEEPPLFEVGPGRRNKCWLVKYPERRAMGGWTDGSTLAGTAAATPVAGELPDVPAADDLEVL